MELPESQLKDCQFMRLLEQQQPMPSTSIPRAVKETSLHEPEMVEEEEDDIFLLTHSTLNLLTELWNCNKSMLQNLKVAIGFIQSYSMNQAKIDPNTVRMREARLMRDYLINVLDIWKKKKKRGASTACSVEDLRIFLIEEHLTATLAEDIMLENTFHEWLEDFKEFTSRRPTLRVDTNTTKTASVGGDGLKGLFNIGNFKGEEIDERISQYITRLENGRMNTVRTPGEIGHSLIRLDLYEVQDILKKDKRDWWKYAKLRSQILTSSITDPKYQLMNQLLDKAADGLLALSGLRKESSNSFAQ